MESLAADFERMPVKFETVHVNGCLGHVESSAVHVNFSF